MSERDIIERTHNLPATTQSLATDLTELGVATGDVLLVHASLSSLGWVCGGAVAVIDALKAAVGPSGTIVMPTHSADLSEPARWNNPPVPPDWWPIIRESMPAFSRERTPTYGMGKIAECFRSQTEVVRSDHPHVSFAARGPQAVPITSDHELTASLDDHSPLGKLYAMQSTVLLLGVSHDRNTSLHLAETRAYGDDMPKARTAAPIEVNGERRWVEFQESDFDDTVFPQIGEAFANRTGLVKTGKVAMAQALLMPQPPLVDFGTRWLQENRSDKTA